MCILGRRGFLELLVLFLLALRAFIFTRKREIQNEEKTDVSVA